MGLDDFEVFNDFTYTTATEVLRQQIDLFNSATGGAIILEAADNGGDYTDETMYAKIDGLVRRRNAYANTTVSEKEMEMLLDTSVKVAAGTPPVRIDPHWWDWINRSQEEAGIIYGRQLAVDMFADMLNTAIMAIVAAMLNDTEIQHDGTSGICGYDDLLKGTSKFGDRSNDIRIWIAHSKVMFDIWGTNLTNSPALFTFGTVSVKTDPFGRPIVMTDSPSLVNDSPSPDLYYTLGLTPGAVRVEQNNDFLQNIETSNGFENIRRTIQSQWTYNLGVKGYAWDKASGGHSPNDGAIASSASWDRYVTSHKDLPGTLVITQ